MANSDEETALPATESTGLLASSDGGKQLQAISNSKEKHGFQAEYNHVKETIEAHFQEADDGDDFFLAMSLTSNLSLLPTKDEMEHAVMKLSHRVSQRVDEKSTSPSVSKVKALDDDTTSSPPLHAYLNVAAAILSLSSLGPLLDRLDGVPPPIKIVWRMQGTAMVLLPLAAQAAWHNPPRLSLSQWCTFVTAAICYCTMAVAFAVSLNYTTVNDATILTNSQSLLLVIAKLFTGSPVALMEGLGVVVAFTGVVLCAQDSAAISSSLDDGSGDGASRLLASEDNANLTLYGDALALFSAGCGAGYIILGKSVRSHLEVYVFMWLNMAIGSSMIIVFLWITGEEFYFSRDRHCGIWGWMNLEADRLPVEIATVVICNLIGAMGFVRAFQYFSGVTMSAAPLLEPVTATFIAVVLDVGVFPGWMGWVGNVLVIVGTLAVF